MPASTVACMSGISLPKSDVSFKSLDKVRASDLNGPHIGGERLFIRVYVIAFRLMTCSCCIGGI
jgi:hypothetical protein